MPHDDTLDLRADALTFGLDALDDPTLLALLLGQARGGPAPEVTARELLDEVGGLSGLARYGPARFVEQSGLGVARALRLGAGLELARRLSDRAPPFGERLDSPERAVEFLTGKLGALLHEEMWVLSLDASNRLRGARRVGQGGLHALSISPADVLRAALWDGAASFILAHNHPSGRLEASREDVETTVRLGVVSLQLGVPMVDHLIITSRGHLSLAALGLVDRASEDPAPRRSKRRGRPHATTATRRGEAPD
ncbi:MAG: DNA repair protein [Deltaproteobacteria bacterium]|nr:DNA repair protein [Deltaproteobacteria bacterium]